MVLKAHYPEKTQFPITKLCYNITVGGRTNLRLKQTENTMMTNLNTLFRTCLITSTLGIGASTIAYAAGKHIHGEAEAFIVIEGTKVLIEVESPADNILGFEHAPKTQEQKKHLKNMLTTLNDYRSVITVTNADCKSQSTKVDSPFTVSEEDAHHDKHEHQEKHEHHDHEKHEKHEHHDHEKHEKHGHHDHEKHEHHDHDKHDEDTHKDFLLAYELSCSSTLQAQQLNFPIFKHLSGLEKLTVNWVINNKQGSSILTREKTSL